MTRVTVTTRVLATVTEEWDLELPAGVDPATVQDWLEVLDQSAGSAARPASGSSPAVVILAVRDVEVTDEIDRAVVSWRPLTADAWYVFDPIEMRAWGPFHDEAAAEAFQRQDKYLQGSALIVDGPPPVPTDRTWPPDAY